jgi:hypothetical protein
MLEALFPYGELCPDSHAQSVNIFISVPDPGRPKLVPKKGKKISVEESKLLRRHI